MSSKAILDALLTQYKAQPASAGYIDVIVMRENYRPFAEALLKNGFMIEAITWLEYIPNFGSRPRYGMGGPKSKFYTGWFAEICFGDDEIQLAPDPAIILKQIVDLVENKRLDMHDFVITYRTTPSLTAAFWLDVDDRWENVQYSMDGMTDSIA